MVDRRFIDETENFRELGMSITEKDRVMIKITDPNTPDPFKEEGFVTITKEDTEELIKQLNIILSLL